MQPENQQEEQDEVTKDTQTCNMFGVFIKDIKKDKSNG